MKDQRKGSEGMDVFVIGAGGHSKIVLEILEEDPSINIKGLLDDNKALHGKQVMGYPILGAIDGMGHLFSKGIGFVISIGNNGLRCRLADRLKDLGFHQVSAISKHAVISGKARVGAGVIINPGVVIHPDVTIDDDVVLGMNATISHDSVIGRGAHLSPGVHITGNARVGALADLGAGVVVIPQRSVGEGTIVGAGAVVTKDLPQGVVAVGAPAKPIKSLKEPKE